MFWEPGGLCLRLNSPSTKLGSVIQHLVEPESSPVECAFSDNCEQGRALSSVESSLEEGLLLLNNGCDKASLISLYKRLSGLLLGPMGRGAGG